MLLQNNNEIKISTEQQVLSHIIKYGASSRKEIAEAIGVTGSTLTKASSVLIEENIIYEIGVVEDGRVGRKQIMLDVHGDFCYALGFDITNTTICVTMLDVKSRIKAEKEWVFNILEQKHLDEAIEFAKELLYKYRDERVLGVGLLTQGYIENNICFSLPIANIRQQLADALQIDVISMNNVRSLAITEMYLKNPCKDFIMIKYGPGIGGVIVSKGEIMQGVQGCAGEIGHIKLNYEASQPCAVCGKKGCLESQICFSQLIKNAAPELADLPEVLDNVLKAGEVDSYKTIKLAMEELAKAIIVFSDICDPEKIFLAGDIFTERDFYSYLIEAIKWQNRYFDVNKVIMISDYRNKRKKAAGTIVLNNYFGKR